VSGAPLLGYDVERKAIAENQAKDRAQAGTGGAVELELK
jgi:hypothetical protein